MKNRTLATWLSIGHLASDWPISSLWIIAPAAGLAMGLTPGEVGLLFTLFSLGGALAFLPAGLLADHVSDRGRLLVITLWWVAVGYGLSAFASGYWSLVLLLSAAGMGNAAWHPIAAGVLARGDRERRAQAFGIHGLGGAAAEVLAPLAAGFLLAFVEWRSALAIAILPTIVVALLFLKVSRAVPLVEPRPVRAADLKALFDAWRRGNGLRLIAMISLHDMAHIALLAMIPLYLTATQGLGPAVVGVIFSGLLVVGAVAQPLVGRLSDRIGRRPVLIAGNLVAAAAGGLLVLPLPFWLVIAMLAIAVASLDVIRPAMLAAAVDHTDEREATTLGLAYALMDGVGALGAVIGGIAAGYSWPHLFGVAALLALGSAALSWKPSA